MTTPAEQIVSNGYIYKLVGPVPAPAAPTAVSRMAAWSKDVSALGFNVHDMCLRTVRTAFGVPAKAPTAYNAWLLAGGSKGADTHTVLNAPANVPGFFKGAGPDGHIVVCAGGGMCWSTDIHGNGTIALVSIKEIESKWGMKWLGWSETLNGVRVWSK